MSVRAVLRYCHFATASPLDCTLSYSHQPLSPVSRLYLPVHPPFIVLSGSHSLSLFFSVLLFRLFRLFSPSSFVPACIPPSHPSVGSSRPFVYPSQVLLCFTFGPINENKSTTASTTVTTRPLQQAGLINSHQAFTPNYPPTHARVAIMDVTNIDTKILSSTPSSTSFSHAGQSLGRPRKQSVETSMARNRREAIALDGLMFESSSVEGLTPQEVKKYRQHIGRPDLVTCVRE
jgi:hypothetical protein